MLPPTMTPTKIRERLEEAEDGVDLEAYYEALQYVHDDGRTRKQ